MTYYYVDVKHLVEVLKKEHPDQKLLIAKIEDSNLYQHAEAARHGLREAAQGKLSPLDRLEADLVKRYGVK